MGSNAWVSCWNFSRGTVTWGLCHPSRSTSHLLEPGRPDSFTLIPSSPNRGEAARQETLRRPRTSWCAGRCSSGPATPLGVCNSMRRRGRPAIARPAPSLDCHGTLTAVAALRVLPACHDSPSSYFDGMVSFRLPVSRSGCTISVAWCRWLLLGPLFLLPACTGSFPNPPSGELPHVLALRPTSSASTPMALPTPPVSRPGSAPATHEGRNHQGGSTLRQVGRLPASGYRHPLHPGCHPYSVRL
jgi:hypothetical protein